MTVPLMVDDIAGYQSGDVDVYLSAANAAVRSFCKWHIAPAVTETVTVSEGFVGNSIRVPSLFLTSVSGIVVDSTVVDLTTVEIFDYGVVRMLAGYDWSWLGSVASRTATVTMTHGYPTTPADVVAVIGSVASRAGQSPDGVVRTQVGTVSTTYSQSSFNVAGGVALLEFEKDILSKYRIPGAT